MTTPTHDLHCIVKSLNKATQMNDSWMFFADRGELVLHWQSLQLITLAARRSRHPFALVQQQAGLLDVQALRTESHHQVPQSPASSGWRAVALRLNGASSRKPENHLSDRCSWDCVECLLRRVHRQGHHGLGHRVIP